MRRILFLLCLFAASAAYAEGAVSICVQAGLRWVPYSYQEAGQEDVFKGASIDVIREVFAELEMDYYLQPLPWGRVLQTLRDKEGCDVVWDMSKNNTRIAEVLFTEPLYGVQVGAFYSKVHNPNMKTYKGVLGLLDYNVCGIRGYNYEPVEELVSIFASHRRQALELLARGRCDIFVGAYEPVFHGAQLGLFEVEKDIEFVHGAAFDRTLHAGVSRNAFRANELHEKLNKVLRKLRKSGRLAQIYAQHNL